MTVLITCVYQYHYNNDNKDDHNANNYTMLYYTMLFHAMLNSVI